MADEYPFRIWEGVYPTFAEVNADDAVFAGKVWVDKVVMRTRDLLSAAASDAAISPVTKSHDYVLPAVIAAIATPDRKIRILDFGGGLGSSFIPLAGSLTKNQPIEFVVIENSAVCAVGSEMFATEGRISFHPHMPTPPKRFDLVHCGSSLHYVEDWMGMVAQFVKLNPDYLVFADLPAADNRTFVTAQAYYGKRIAVWFWNVAEFIEAIEGFGYRLAFKAQFRGTFLKPGSNIPTDHFDAEHRLNYFSQLMFRRTSQPLSEN